MKWLVMADLAEQKKLARTWTALNDLIKNEGFPPGRMSGRNRI